MLTPVDRLLETVWATLFPARCLGCGRRGVALCPPCRATLPYLDASACQRCAWPSRSAGPCRACKRIPAALASVRAVCAYEGAARQAVHTLKFRSGRYLAPVLGQLLCEVATRRPLQADLVVPVPLAPRRLRDRGYNQAELLAEHVVESVGGTLAARLLEREDRAPQQTLTAVERRTNLRGAFSCANPEAAHGQRILLVDDVMTTGATLGACAEVLVTAGASRVSALVFARDL
jgi:ComF family protein